MHGANALDAVLLIKKLNIFASDNLSEDSFLLDLEKKKIIFGYDVDIGLHLATVLSGGDTTKSKELSEADLYNLERQSLINLIQSNKTRDRIHAMLSTGRRLKN